MKKDLYNSNQRLKAIIKRIDDSKDSNKKVILQFVDNCFAKGLGAGRVLCLLSRLKRLSSMLGKEFEKANKEDIMRLVQKLEMSNYAESTKAGYKSCLKQFYKWLRGDDKNYPQEVEWIKERRKNGNHKLPEELLTEEDVKKMIEAADHPRDKALVAVLYESGCRIAELLSLSIKNVSFDKYGAKLMVDGKTGMRRVRIVSSTPALATWFDSHPFKEYLGASLWLGIGTRNKNKGLRYDAIKRLLERIAEKAGIKKKVNPHAFRHARATHLANHLTEAQMKEYFGWVRNSDMASIYIHLSGRDTDKALLELYGLKKEGKEEMVLKPKVCSRCKTSNSPTSDFCRKCGQVLSPETIIDVDEKTKEWNGLMTSLMKDKETRDAIIKGINKLRLQEKVMCS